MTNQEQQKKLKEFEDVANRWEAKADYLTTMKMFKDLNEYFCHPEDEDEC